MPKVSICVPVYKVENYIERCAESLFNQTLDDLEFIFVDDCSPDNTMSVLRQIISKYPNLKIKIIQLKENVGPGIARRKAAEYASGDYLYIPDSDDWIDATMLEEMYSLANEQHADLIKCRQTIETKRGSEKSDDEYPSDNAQWFDAVISRKTSIGLCSYLIDHKLYLKAIDGMTEERMVRFEDYLLTIRLHYYSKKSILLDKYMYHINSYNEGSITKTLTEEAITSCLKAADLLESFLNQIEYNKNKSEIVLRLRENGFENYLFDENMYCPDKWRYYYSKYGMSRHSIFHPNTLIRKLTIKHYDKLALLLLNIRKYIIKLL